MHRTRSWCRYSWLKFDSVLSKKIPSPGVLSTPGFSFWGRVRAGHYVTAWPESEVLVRRLAARYSKQARRVYRTLLPIFRKTGPPPRTLFVERVASGSPVIRLASAGRTASSSQPGLTCKMSVRDGRVGSEGVGIIFHPHAVAVGNMNEHERRDSAVGQFICSISGVTI